MACRLGAAADRTVQAGRAIATPSAAAKGGRGSAGGAGGRLLGRREPEKRKTDAILEAAACFPAATPRCPRSSATQSNVARLGTQHPCLPRTGAIGTNARRCLNPSPKQRGHPGAPRRAIPGLCPLSPACHTSPRRPPALKTLPLTFVAQPAGSALPGRAGTARSSSVPPQPPRGRTDAPRPHRPASSPRSASRTGQRQGGGRAEEAAAPLCIPPPPFPLAGRLRGGAGAILGTVSPSPPPPGWTGALGTRGAGVAINSSRSAGAAGAPRGKVKGCPPEAT